MAAASAGASAPRTIPAPPLAALVQTQTLQTQVSTHLSLIFMTATTRDARETRGDPYMMSGATMRCTSLTRHPRFQASARPIPIPRVPSASPRTLEEAFSAVAATLEPLSEAEVRGCFCASRSRHFAGFGSRCPFWSSTHALETISRLRLQMDPRALTPCGLLLLS